MSAPAAGPLRVAVLNPVFWPEVRRGSERFARDLADGLLARGHRARLITSHAGPPSRTVEHGLEVVRNWRPPSRCLSGRGYGEHLTHLPFSYMSLVRGDDDIAQALYPTDGLAAVRWSERTGRPAVVSYMGVASRPYLAKRRLRPEITLRAMRGAAAVTALSGAAADSLRRWLGVEARVISPGVNLDGFPLGEERAEAPTVFSPVAAEQPQKRIALLVEAMELVRRDRPGARLVLSRPRDRALAASLAGAGAELADVDDRAALAREYGRAWVGALPSLTEAFGLVLVESFSCGTPVVAANVDGVSELVDRPEIGRLFDGDEPGELARALLGAFELAGDPRTRAACRARAEDFSSERCTDAHVALYRELLAGRAA